MSYPGIFFDRIHSYNDLNLVLSKLEISPATPKSYYVNIPGGDGSIDMTENHGEVKYHDRDCKFTFTAIPGTERDWERLKTKVNNAINGKVFRITLDKDPEHYYEGRCAVDNYAVSKWKKQIIVTARVKPWKFKQKETVAAFNLSDTEKVVTLSNGRRPVCPVITCTADATVEFDGYAYNLTAGSHKVLNIRFTEGMNNLKISGSGMITFTYQEGEL